MARFPKKKVWLILKQQHQKTCFFKQTSFLYIKKTRFFANYALRFDFQNENAPPCPHFFQLRSNSAVTTKEEEF